MKANTIHQMLKMASDAGFTSPEYIASSDHSFDDEIKLNNEWHIQIGENYFGAVRQVKGSFIFKPERKTFALALADTQRK